MDMTWEKSSRILKSRDFRLIQRKGSKLKSRDFLFIFLSANRMRREDSHPRFGLVVSKKVGNAVCRNLVKRRIREACRRNKHLLKLPLNVVIIAFSSALHSTQKDVDKQVSTMFEKLNTKTRSKRKRTV